MVEINHGRLRLSDQDPIVVPLKRMSGTPKRLTAPSGYKIAGGRRRLRSRACPVDEVLFLVTVDGNQRNTMDTCDVLDVKELAHDFASSPAYWPSLNPCLARPPAYIHRRHTAEHPKEPPGWVL